MVNYKYESDEELVEIIRSKDKDAYILIVRGYQDKLMRYVTFLIQDADKSADVVQETFIKAFVNLQGFDTKKKFSSWIYRIAHNEAMNAIKKYSREVNLSPELDIPSNQNVEEEYSKKEVVKMARKCLGKIPVIYSEPLELFYLEDKSYEEISDILRLNIGTIGTRISRAKVIMKKICQKKN